MTEQRDDQDVDESLGMFEAALQAKSMALPAPTFSKILVVPDRSDQEESTRALAQALGDLTMAPVSIRDSIPGTGEVNGAAAGILKVLREEEASVLVIPAPYGDHLDALQGESLSVTIDMLLLESPVPLLIVRGPLNSPMKTLKNPLLLLDWDEVRHRHLGAWGAFLAGKGGDLHAIAVPDPEVLEAIEHLAGEDEEGIKLSKAIVSRAETRLSGSLVAALQKKGKADGFDVKFEVRNDGSPGPVAAAIAEDASRVLLVAYKRSRSSSSLSHARAAILDSKQPVLAIGI